MLIAQHTVALTGEGAPEWVHLVPAGTFSGVDGRGPYVLKDPAAVIAASMTAGKLPIDENHSTDLAPKLGQPSPARGWIVAMESRDGGLWGQVEWTPSGTALMNEKAYGGLSPVFRYDQAGVVACVLRAALTNLPNLHLTALNSRENPVDLAALRTALGLPETADEAACLAAVTSHRQAIAAHASELTAIRTAAGLDAALSADGIAIALQTRQASTPDVARLNETIVTLQTQVATLTSGAAKDKAVLFVDTAIKAGKPITPVRDYWIARHQQEPAETERVINALPSINDGGIVRHAQEGGGDGGDALTDADNWVIEKMGLDPKAYAEQKAKLAGTTDGRAA